MTKKRIIGLAFAVGIFGLVALAPKLLRGEIMAVGEALVAASFATAGAIAWLRRPERRTGALLLLIGFLWPLGAIEYYRTPLAWTAANLTSNLWLLGLIYLLLVFPGSRLGTTRNKAFFVAAVFLGFVLDDLVATVFLDCRAFREFTAAHCDGLNLVHVSGHDRIAEAVPIIVQSGATLFLLILGADIRRRWRRTSRPARRAFTPVVIGGFATACLVVLINILVDHVVLFERHAKVIVTFGVLALGAVPFGFLVGLLQAHARRARVGDLVVELSELPEPRRLQASLRKALGDPSLVAAVWAPDAKRYLATDGQPFDIPEEDAVQVVTFLDRGGEPLAAIVHDRALLDDPSLVESVKAATRLAVENERLHDEVLAQLAEVHASRARIVQAADDARRRIERDLHDGAQQRLVSLSLSLRLLATRMGDDADPDLKESLEGAARGLQEALGELRDLARGIHPVILSEEGLAAALDSLAERASMRVELRGLPHERLPEPVEVAAYYLCAEALSNSSKHADASTARISARVHDERLRVEVTDDGCGGASVGGGSGLRGLADRIHALDGTLEIISPTGKGTTIVADIPLELNPQPAPLPSVSGVPALVRERTRPSEADGTTGHATRPLLACRGIDFFYGRNQALANVDLDIYPGDVVALLGTNGAGKSTLLRIVAGLAEPAGGTIHYRGEDISFYPAETRAGWGIAYVPGGNGVFAPLSVLDNLRVFANGQSKGEVAERMERVFDTFPVLADRRHELAVRLSRGQQQMLSLSKTFMADATLLVIDELCLGLAPEITEEVLSVVPAIVSEGTAVLVVDQSSGRALTLAERAYFLDAGSIVFAGTPDALERRADLLRSVFVGKAAAELTHA